MTPRIEAQAGTRQSSLLFAIVLLAACVAVVVPASILQPGRGSPPHRALVAAGTPAATGPLSGFFPIGVWVPPAADFAKWKDRGVNTVVEVPQGHDIEAWTAEARALGLRMVRAPRPDPKTDGDEPLLLAWLLPDEPETRNLPARSIQDLAAAWKAANGAIPVMLNVSGGHVLGLQGWCDTRCYRSYVAASDWVSSDIYPVTGWNRPDALGWVGEVLRTLRDVSGDRPLFAFIETSHQRLGNGPHPGRGVTPGELRAQIWEAVIAGARGIWYFSAAFEPFEFDATPPEVVDELSRQNALLTSLGPVLQGEISPGPFRATAREPLRLAWRSTPSMHYVIVLNSSQRPRPAQLVSLGGQSASQVRVYGEDRTLPVVAGALRDDFGPYAVHIYEVDRSSPSGPG